MVSQETNRSSKEGPKRCQISLGCAQGKVGAVAALHTEEKLVKGQCGAAFLTSQQVPAGCSGLELCSWPVQRSWSICCCCVLSGEGATLPHFPLPGEGHAHP